MKLKNLAGFLALVALLIWLPSTHSRMAAASPAHRDKLHLVKKIYIGEEKEYVLSELGAVKQTRLISNLSDELNRVGFVVVDDSASADATLKGEFGWNAVLHGPQPGSVAKITSHV